jgi:hypothetical protein
MIISKQGGNLMQKFKPGELAPKSGQYRIVDANGQTMYTVDVERGEHLPPTQSSDWHLEID